MLCGQKKNKNKNTNLFKKKKKKKNHTQKRTLQLAEILIAAMERGIPKFQLTQVKIQDASRGGCLVRFRRDWC